MKLFIVLLLTSAAYGDDYVVAEDWVVSDWLVSTGLVTCSKDYFISEAALTQEECKAEAVLTGGSHIYYQSSEDRNGNGDWCHIYSSCDTTRVPDNPGTTFEVAYEVEWEVVTFDEELMTCTNDGTNRVYLDKVEEEDCKAAAEALGAGFLYWQSAEDRGLSKPLCHVYAACDETRVPSTPGTTYQMASGLSEVSFSVNTCDGSNGYRFIQKEFTLEGCKAKAEENGFHYIFWQPVEIRDEGDWCHIYKTCDETRTPSTGGINYSY